MKIAKRWLGNITSGLQGSFLAVSRNRSPAAKSARRSDFSGIVFWLRTAAMLRAVFADGLGPRAKSCSIESDVMFSPLTGSLDAPGSDDKRSLQTAQPLSPGRQ